MSKLEKQVPLSPKLQILLNRVLEKDFKANMEVEAFASQSTVEELFMAYKQVDQRVKSSSKELERYYYNNYYSFIESAKEQIDTTKLLEQVNNKLANQYIPLIEEINSSFEGIRDQLADELMKYEQLKKFSIAKKQSGWVTDLFVNLEKSFHRLKGLVPIKPQAVNYKVYGYIIKCAYHIRNYVLLYQHQQQSPNIVVFDVLSKCKNVLSRINTLIQQTINTGNTWTGSWPLEYPVLVIIHAYLIEIQIPSDITILINNQFLVLLKPPKLADVLSSTTNEQFMLTRNSILRDVCLFTTTCNAFDVTVCNESNSNNPVILHHIQLNSISSSIFKQLYSTIVLLEPLLLYLESLLLFSLKKDFIGEHFNANKITHFLRNFNAECHQASTAPYSFLIPLEILKIEESVVNVPELNYDESYLLNMELFQPLYASLSATMLELAITTSFQHCTYLFLSSLNDLVNIPIKQVHTGMLEVERLLESTIATIHQQLFKLNIDKSLLSRALYAFWQQTHLVKHPTAQLVLARICFDSDLHLIKTSFTFTHEQIDLTEIKQIARINAKLNLGHFIMHHCYLLTDIIKEYPLFKSNLVSQCLLNAMEHIKKVESILVVFDEQKKGHAKKYSLDDRYSSPVKQQPAKMNYVLKLMRKHVDYYPQMPSNIKNELQLKIELTKESIIEHLILCLIKYLIETTKNRFALFHLPMLNTREYEQLMLDIEYLKIAIKYCAVEDDKYMMVLLEELKGYGHLMCLVPKTPDGQMVEEVRKLVKI